MPESIIRWGILAPGGIARTFARALAEAPGARMVAVGSRDQGRAQRFAAEFQIPRAHGSYAELAADPEVDAVYIASPHSAHCEHTLLCLDAGKHVLCEKSLAVNAGQVAQMIEAARARKLVLLEAMWTRFLPLFQQLREMIAQGDLGEVRLLQADFGFHAAFDPDSRLFAPELAGGTLLDLGIYPVSLSSLLFGRPTSIQATANLGETGVDEELAAILHHAGGQLTVLSTSFRAVTPREAVIAGTRGRVRIHTPWWGATRMTVTREGHEDQLIELPTRGGGYTHMAEAFMDQVRSGRLESAVMPLDESMTIMQTMDEIRRQVGVVYPGEADR